MHINYLIIAIVFPSVSLGNEHVQGIPRDTDEKTVASSMTWHSGTQDVSKGSGSRAKC